MTEQQILWELTKDIREEMLAAEQAHQEVLRVVRLLKAELEEGKAAVWDVLAHGNASDCECEQNCDNCAGWNAKLARLRAWVERGADGNRVHQAG